MFWVILISWPHSICFYTDFQDHLIRIRFTWGLFIVPQKQPICSLRINSFSKVFDFSHVSYQFADFLFHIFHLLQCVFFSVSANLKRKNSSKVVDIPQCLPAYVGLTIFFLGGVGFAPMFASLSVWSGQIEHWIASPKAADIRYWILAKVLLSPACQTNSFKPVVFHSISLKWLTNFITEDIYPDKTVESLWSPDLLMYKMLRVCQGWTFR